MLKLLFFSNKNKIFQFSYYLCQNERQFIHHSLALSCTLSVIKGKSKGSYSFLMKQSLLLSLMLITIGFVACKQKKTTSSSDKLPVIDSIKPITQFAKKCGQIPMTEEQQRDIVALYGKLNDEIERETEDRDAVAAIPEMLHYPIVVHVITDNGRINIPRVRILDGISTLNRVYEKVYMKFDLLKVDSIASTKRLEDLYYGIWNTETDEFFDKFNKDKVLNIYLLDNSADGSYLNGFTYPVDLTLATGRNRDLICIGMRTVDNGKTLVHEVGHFFTLLHTFNVNGCGGGCRTEEMADGSNCATTGDLICDTPADPADPNYIDVRTCRYYGDIKDERGNPYNPLINNFMSYYDACCDYKFTPQQYAIIRKIANNYRHYLKRKPVTPPTTTTTTTPVASTTATTPKTTVAPATTTKIVYSPKPNSTVPIKPKVSNPVSKELPGAAEKKLQAAPKTVKPMPAKPVTTATKAAPKATTSTVKSVTPKPSVTTKTTATHK